MQTVTLKEAQRQLPELIHNLPTDGELLIVEDERPLARLVLAAQPSLHDLKPDSVGAVLRPYPSAQDDLLGEMLGSEK